jgi:peptidoglycan hydrolase-like protein with peptidoglycan-binding domain
LILLRGHFAHTGHETWLIGSNGDGLNAVNIGAQALPVVAILDMAGAHPGGAVVLLAPADDTPDDLPGLTPGLGMLDIPQGVSIITGPVDQVARLITGPLLEPGLSVRSAVDQVGRELVLSGFAPDRIPYLPSEGGSLVDEEAVHWRVVRSMGSTEAYESYLRTYPRGRFQAEAEREIQDLRDAPLREAEAAEQALALDREARKEIQRNLALLEFDPRGIDGIFGRGTRAAITRWQSANGFEANSFLSRDQITRLAADARTRAAQLEEEARQRRLEQEREDRDYWRATGQSGAETDLRAYLARYPDGLYSDIARDQLSVFDAQRRAEAAAEERAYWDDIVEADTPTAYRDYLERYPDGAFVEAANGRLQELEGSGVSEAEIEAARREEETVARIGVTRVLAERRLRALGFDPGEADGKLTDKTRQAIRRFQREQDLPPTGYLTQDTMVRLLVN